MSGVPVTPASRREGEGALEGVLSSKLARRARERVVLGLIALDMVATAVTLVLGWGMFKR